LHINNLQHKVNGYGRLAEKQPVSSFRCGQLQQIATGFAFVMTSLIGLNSARAER
jgi:hypothetical protein